jgi:hypothetical protein
MSAKIVSLKAVRELKSTLDAEQAYLSKIGSLSKVELLEEMVRFQEERTRLGALTPEMMKCGRHLFERLEGCADTQELKILTRSYRRHLEYELEEFVRNHPTAL